MKPKANLDHFHPLDKYQSEIPFFVDKKTKTRTSDYMNVEYLWTIIWRDMDDIKWPQLYKDQNTNVIWYVVVTEAMMEEALLNITGNIDAFI